MASHFRRMLISKNHINPQLVLPKMRFLAAHFGLKLAQNRVCSSKQKTSLAWVKLTFLRFYRSYNRLKFDASPGGPSGPPAAGSGPIWVPNRPQIDRKSTPNRSNIDPRNGYHSCCMPIVLLHVVHLIPCCSSYRTFIATIVNSNLSRSSYCMTFILSVVRHHDHQFKSNLLHAVPLICRSS